MKKFFEWNSTEEWEYMYVPKTIADKLSEAADRETQESFFLKAIEDRKKDIKNEIEALEDDVLMFKGIGLKVKNELEKAYDVQAEQIEKIFMKINGQDTVFGKTQKLKEDVDSIESTIKEIDRKISYMRTSNLEKAIELIGRFNRMDKKDKELLLKLFEVEENR